MLANQEEEGKGLGHPSKPQPPPSTAQPTNKDPIPDVASSSHQKTQTPRQALNKVNELPQTGEPIPNVVDEDVYKEWEDRVEKAATTVASLDVEQASGNINRTQSTIMPNVPLHQGIGAHGSLRSQEAMGGSIAQARSERSNDPPLSRGHTLGIREDSIELIKELMETCTKLSIRVLSLEESKTAQDLVITRLQLRVKKLEKKKKKARTLQPLKRRLFKVRVESSVDENLDEEDPSKQGKRKVTLTQVSAQGEAHSQEYQPEDQLGVLSAAKVLADAARKNVQSYTRRRRAVSTGSDGISTASRLFSIAEESISTAGASCQLVLLQEQDRLGYEAAVRLQEELDDEERQRMSRVHEAAQSFTEEEWENIRARVKAKEELARRLRAEERSKYSEVDQAKILKLEVLREVQKKNLIMKVLRGKKTNEASGDDLVMLWSLVKERSSLTVPTDDKEITLWVELKRLFELDTNDTLWKLQ
nr:hypothetical protein [Tanacetum cinerariifolium]